jgi:hypothetical protein
LSGQIIETRIKTGVFENEIIQVAAAERRRLEKVSCVGQKQEAAALDKSPPDRKYRCIMQFAAREEGRARERTKTRSRRAPGPDPFALIPCSNRTSASSSTHDGDGPGNENHKRRTVRGSKILFMAYATHALATWRIAARPWEHSSPGRWSVPFPWAASPREATSCS